MNELFVFLQDINICNFADDTTSLVCDVTLESAPEKLEGKLELAIFWFESNYMKVTDLITRVTIIGRNANVARVNRGSGGLQEHSEPS